MSGYSFYCSNCKISHAGECPPSKAKHPITKGQVDYELLIQVGSRWKGERRDIGGQTWFKAGHDDGYEVVAIISDGTTTGNTFIQAKAYNEPAAVVWTLDIDYWFEDGHYNGPVGCNERMVPWV